MKKNIFIHAIAIMSMLFVCTAINAREWHINNANGMPAHFADINAAMASEEVVAGDTLYIGAGAVLGAQTISKAVTVIGTGWGYGDSPVTPANVNGNLKITAEYAKVIGLHVIGEIHIATARRRHKTPKVRLILAETMIFLKLLSMMLF